ncbi:MAG: RnfABCDGE type electron transport complex subunit D [Tissierellia bacterium]|nr:RnfABCDGE type electron transport complex subunit D [Tissierellia bacterium]
MFSFFDKVMNKQKMMRTVLLAALPILLFSTYLFGLKTLVLTLFNIVIAVLVEYICETKIYKRKKVSEAVVVTAVLYSMTLPVSIPFWISAIGIAFAVFFGKMVFGGFGKNVFNPALVGRAFIYVNFPQPLTIYWNEASFGGLGGFTKWITPTIDSATSATPMLAFRNAGQQTGILDLFIGNISGSIGETSALLILLAAIYLVYKKVASWEIMVSSVVGFAGLTVIFNFMGIDSVLPVLKGLLSGGFLFGAVFMATDPISAPKTSFAKWFYGILIGIVVVIIRGFALFSGGMMFAILIGNTFAPIVDYVVNKNKKKKREQAKLAKTQEVA